ncbi:putative Engulfment and cell motility protein [Naja naja]|nr:putative Engulfment and cell motility protein [Naja naja]
MRFMCLSKALKVPMKTRPSCRMQRMRRASRRLANRRRSPASAGTGRKAQLPVPKASLPSAAAGSERRRGFHDSRFFDDGLADPPMGEGAGAPSSNPRERRDLEDGRPTGSGGAGGAESRRSAEPRAAGETAWHRRPQPSPAQPRAAFRAGLREVPTASERAGSLSLEMPPPPDIVKVAVEWPGANAQLLEFDQKRPLVSIIKEVCDGWSLPNPECHTLRYADGAQLYITEQTRGDIKNGTILQLAVSPSRAARQLMDRTQSSTLEGRLEAMKELAKLSADVTFATEFINMDGIAVLTRLVEGSSKLLSHCGEMLAFTLTAFLELMDHGLVSWDTVSVSFIKQIAGYVSQPMVDVSILQRSLAILESMVLNSQALYQKIAEEVTVGQLLSHLQVSNQEIQTYAVALINALFLKAPEDKRQEMADASAQRQLRLAILTHVIRGNRPIKTEMAHQLYVLQVLSLNLREERMMTKMDPSDQAQRDVLFELRRVAFEAEAESAPGGGAEKRKAIYTRDYKLLGFTSLLISAWEKGGLPGRSDSPLPSRLCPANEGRNDYHPMFFTHDQALEELFAICIQLLNRTWKEMRATAEDFHKVMQVVREQITRALPAKPPSLDQFKGKLRSLGYSEVLRLRQSERMSQDDFQSPPIVELREKIQPEILELIKQQRLNRLCEGSSFRKVGNRRRQERFWHCRLALNHKTLHYGDLEENAQGGVALESLQEKSRLGGEGAVAVAGGLCPDGPVGGPGVIAAPLPLVPVADIKAVLTGKECPHMKEKGALKQNKEALELAFSILYDPDEALNFIAPNKYEFCIWIDGLNALLGKDMASELTKSDLDTLLSMEMKLRLLDLENVQIPEEPPPVPKEPSNYDFVYHYA